MKVVKTAWDAKKDTIERGYGHLPGIMLEDWACHQAALSEAYSAGQLPATSATSLGYKRKQDMLERINHALVKRSNLSQSEITFRLIEADQHLEDPGLLENFEYFDVPSSDYMLQFYFAVWDRRIAEAMDYLHNYGKDLQGIAHEVPKDDIWYQMSYFEGMNIDKRRQAKDVVDFMHFHHITQATSFGGGHIPERLYGLPEDLRLTVFDNGPVAPLKALFPDQRQRQRINYIHEPLSKAPEYRRLLNSQELVWMHGLSMYLDEKCHEMTGAIFCAFSLLRPNGYMRYDYLVRNQSMRRVISTQCWPNNPAKPMVLFDDAEAAIRQGTETLSAVNATLTGKAFMDLADIKVNYIEPWGVTGVYFTVQKHS